MESYSQRELDATQLNDDETLQQANDEQEAFQVDAPEHPIRQSTHFRYGRFVSVCCHSAVVIQRLAIQSLYFNIYP